MGHVAPKVYTPNDTIASRICWRNLPLTATTEQTTIVPDQIMPDGQSAPGSVRPIHRADVHIIEPQGSELWLDVKIHKVAPEFSVAKELLRECWGLEMQARHQTRRKHCQSTSDDAGRHANWCARRVTFHKQNTVSDQLTVLCKARRGHGANKAARISPN